MAWQPRRLLIFAKKLSPPAILLFWILSPVCVFSNQDVGWKSANYDRHQQIAVFYRVAHDAISVKFKNRDDSSPAKVKYQVRYTVKYPSGRREEHSTEFGTMISVNKGSENHAVISPVHGEIESVSVDIIDVDRPREERNLRHGMSECSRDELDSVYVEACQAGDSIQVLSHNFSSRGIRISARISYLDELGKLRTRRYDDLYVGADSGGEVGSFTVRNCSGCVRRVEITGIAAK